MTGNEVDIALGALIRDCRLHAGLSQQDLGRAAGVSFQQVQKYESGQNRISVSRLLRLARALDLPAVEIIRQFEDRLRARPEGRGARPRRQRAAL